MVSTCEFSPFSSIACFDAIQHRHGAAGSSLLLLITNGGSFGAISPTDGRYGSVLIGTASPSNFGLTSSIDRFTPPRAWPLSWAWFYALSAWTLRPQSIVK